MKNIVLLLSIILFALPSLQAQSNNDVSPFENKEPREKNVIFLASLPPCIVGVALDYHEAIGLSEETLNISNEIVAYASTKVPKFKKQLKNLEIELMNASLSERYTDYEEILDKIATLKKEASLFHESLSKRARNEYPKEDTQKIVNFIKKHKKVFIENAGL